MTEEIKKLRGEGYSYSEIAKATNKSRKYAWKYAKNVKFSKSGLQRYKSSVKGIISEIKLQLKNISIPKTRIIGHIFFDGTMYRSKYNSIIRYINSSKELIDQFILDVKKTYGLKKFTIEKYKNYKVPYYKVAFSSKKMYDDLLKYIPLSQSKKDFLPIPIKILKGNKKIKIAFLTTFFTDEGSISNKGRIMADLKNKLMMIQIINLLQEFSLPFKLCEYQNKNGPICKIYLPKKLEYLKKFYELRLFEKSIITHGYNLQKKKTDILKHHLERLKKKTLSTK